MAPRHTPSKVKKSTRGPPAKARPRPKSKFNSTDKDSNTKNVVVTLIAPSTRMTPNRVIFYSAPSPLSNFHQFPHPFSGATAISHLFRLLGSTVYNPERTSTALPIPHPGPSSPVTKLLTLSQFHTTEQFIMACKGWFFEPFALPATASSPSTSSIEDIHAVLLSSTLPAPSSPLAAAYSHTICICLRHPTDPLACKRAGRRTLNFDRSIWDAASIPVVVAALLARADVDVELRRIYTLVVEDAVHNDAGLPGGDVNLGRRDGRVFVEASPRDRVWGAGMGWARVAAGEELRGGNRLGLCHGLAAKEVREKVTAGEYD